MCNLRRSCRVAQDCGNWSTCEFLSKQLQLSGNVHNLLKMLGSLHSINVQDAVGDHSTWTNVVSDMAPLLDKTVYKD